MPAIGGKRASGSPQSCAPPLVTRNIFRSRRHLAVSGIERLSIPDTDVPECRFEPASVGDDLFLASSAMELNEKYPGLPIASEVALIYSSVRLQKSYGPEVLETREIGLGDKQK